MTLCLTVIRNLPLECVSVPFVCLYCAGPRAPRRATPHRGSGPGSVSLVHCHSLIVPPVVAALCLELCLRSAAAVFAGGGGCFEKYCEGFLRIPVFRLHQQNSLKAPLVVLVSFLC